MAQLRYLVMKILTTDFLHMWQHCPLQAMLCDEFGVIPPMELARRSIIRALTDMAPHSRRRHFASNRVAKRFDDIWTDYQLKHRFLDVPTFYDLGEKMQKRANAIAGVLNRALDDGWTYLEGSDVSLDCEKICGDQGKGWKLVHPIEAFMRDPMGKLSLVSVSHQQSVSYKQLREINFSLGVQLHNLIGWETVDEPFQVVIASTKQYTFMSATLEKKDTERIRGWIANVIRSIQYKTASHREISQLNCGYCPVQTPCEDSNVYRRFHQEKQK